MTSDPSPPTRPGRPPFFGRRHRIVILLLAAIAAGIALGLGISLYFGAPATREAGSKPPAAAGAGTTVNVARPTSTLPSSTLPWPTVEHRAAEAQSMLPNHHSAPPSILEDAPAQMPSGEGTRGDEPQVAALPPASAPAPVPELAPVPAWKRFAAAVPLVPGRPMVAVVIDDLGMDRDGTRRAIRLPPPVTLAFLPYAPHVDEQAAAARAAGHELLVHVSMEAESNGNSGPNTLEVGLPPEEIRRRLEWALGSLGGYVGVNNHMGSRFTADAAGMDVVLADLRARGLLFLDSRTTRDTVAFEHARRLGVPTAERQVFLDGTRTREAVAGQLRELERLAFETGGAIAIGHPHDVTLEALEGWLPTLPAKGLQLAPVSAMVVAPTGRANESTPSDEASGRANESTPAEGLHDGPARARVNESAPPHGVTTP